MKPMVPLLQITLYQWSSWSSVLELLVIMLLFLHHTTEDTAVLLIFLFKSYVFVVWVCLYHPEEEESGNVGKPVS